MNVYLYEVEIDKQFQYPDVVTKLVVVEINGLLILSEYQLACASTIYICYLRSSSYENWSSSFERTVLSWVVIITYTPPLSEVLLQEGIC